MQRISIKASLAMFATLAVACGNDGPVTQTQPQEARSPLAVAVASTSVALEGEEVALDGSASTDPDNDIVSYAWTQESGPTGILSNGGSARATFVPPDVNNTASVSFKLTVTDSQGNSNSAMLNLTVVDKNRTPVANAGPDQVVMARDVVQLNGADSSDADAALASYAWRKVEGPAVSFSNTTIASPTFTAFDVQTPTTIVLSLTVTDSEGKTASDEVNIQVNPKAAKLGFSSLPATADRNGEFSVTVQVQNNATPGKIINGGADATLQVTLSGPDGLTIPNASVTATQGAATFSGLVYSDLGSIVLTATAMRGDDTFTVDSPAINITWNSEFPGVLPGLGTVAVSAVGDASTGWFYGGWFDNDAYLTLDATDMTDDGLGTDAFIALGDATGSTQWVRVFQDSGNERITTAIANSAGDLLVALRVTADIEVQEPAALEDIELEPTGQNAAIIKLDADTGNTVWAFLINGPETEVLHMFLDGDTLYAAGNESNNAALWSIDLADLTTGLVTPTINWTWKTNGASTFGAVRDLEKVGDNILAVGAFAGADLTFNPNDVPNQVTLSSIVGASSTGFALLLNTQGALVSTFSGDGVYTGGGNTSSTDFIGLSNHDTRFVIAAVYEGEGSFGGALVDARGKDGALVVLDSNGAFVSQRVFGSTGDDYINSTTSHASTGWLGGFFAGDADLTGDQTAELTLAPSAYLLGYTVSTEGNIVFNATTSLWTSSEGGEVLPTTLAANSLGHVLLAFSTYAGIDFTIDLDPRATEVNYDFTNDAPFLVKLSAEQELIK